MNVELGECESGHEARTGRGAVTPGRVETSEALADERMGLLDESDGSKELSTSDNSTIGAFEVFKVGPEVS